MQNINSPSSYQARFSNPSRGGEGKGGEERVSDFFGTKLFQKLETQPLV